MNAEQNKFKPDPKKDNQAEELKTEGPLSEKDEVKAAEQKMAKLNKKATQADKGSK